MVRNGSVFRPGQTFQIGWMITQVHQHDATHLTLFEPDMESMPIKWTPGITHSLRTLMLQLFMLDSVNLRSQMQPASAMHSLIACTRYTERDFFMHRMTQPDASDTGWFVGCLDRSHNHNAPANLTRVSVYEAYLRQRGAQGFLSLPVGSMIVFDQTAGISILKDGRALDIVEGSYLSRVFESPGRGER